MNKKHHYFHNFHNFQVFHPCNTCKVPWWTRTGSPDVCTNKSPLDHHRGKAVCQWNSFLMLWGWLRAAGDHGTQIGMLFSCGYFKEPFHIFQTTRDGQSSFQKSSNGTTCTCIELCMPMLGALAATVDLVRSCYLIMLPEWPKNCQPGSVSRTHVYRCRPAVHIPGIGASLIWLDFLCRSTSCWICQECAKRNWLTAMLPYLGLTCVCPVRKRWYF